MLTLTRRRGLTGLPPASRSRGGGVTLLCLLVAALLVVGDARANPYVDAVMADRPISYWPLNDRDVVAEDIRGINPGMLRVLVSPGAPGPIAGMSAMLFHYNDPLGATNHGGCPAIITTGDARALAFRHAGAVEAWIKPAAPGVIVRWRWFGYALLILPDGTLELGLSLQQGNAIPEVDARGQQVVVDAVNPRWHHVVGTWDGSRVSLWVDGIVDGAAADAPATGTVYYEPADTSDTGEFAIGRDGDACNLPFVGSMAHVAVYGRALAPGRIAAHLDAARDANGGQLP